MKLYIHHNYSESLFFKIAHNTTNRQFNGNNIKFDYLSTEYEMIFDKTIHDEEDGLHLLDLMTLIREIYTKQNENFDDLDLSKQEYMPIIERIVTLLENRKNWIILFMLNLSLIHI